MVRTVAQVVSPGAEAAAQVVLPGTGAAAHALQEMVLAKPLK